MKYKVGDKVKIKTWEQMEKEYGLSELENYTNRPFINSRRSFYKNIDEDIEKLKTDRILTVEHHYPHSVYVGYRVKEVEYIIDADWIVKEIFAPINTRFEILDL